MGRMSGPKGRPPPPPPPHASCCLLLAGAVLCVVLTAGGGVVAETPPASAIAVANRDLEGAMVLDADVERNYQATAADCRDQCASTSGCNLWVWCADVSGCQFAGTGTREPRSYQECWLRYDIPPASGRGVFPRFSNPPTQSSGWLSGVAIANFTDAAPTPEQGYNCPCNPSFTYNDTYGNFTFLGTCAKMKPTDSGPACMVDENLCGGNWTGCSTIQPCTVFLDTDLQETKVLVSGETNTAESAEECCGECANTRFCNAWSWCSDAAGCDGERFRFRQCWLKQADPYNPQPKKGYGGSPGWISGVRMSWIPIPIPAPTDSEYEAMDGQTG